MTGRYAKMRGNILRRAFAACAAFAVLCWISAVDFATPVLANPAATQPLSMTATVGYAGYYSDNHWVPVTIMMHNTGKAVHGVLSLQVAGSAGASQVQDGQLTWPVDAGTGWHEYSVAIPGDVLTAPSAPVVELNVNHQIVASTYLNGIKMEKNDLVAVLSSQPTDAQFLTGTAGPDGNPILPVTLRPTDLPDKPNLLDTLTAVVASPDTLFHLTNKQQQSLWTWVRMGGMLFVTGVHWGDTKPELPIVASPAWHWVSGQPLEQFIGGSANVLHSVIMNGQAVRSGAKTVIQGSSTQGMLPLVASISMGRGIVIQTSFSPTQTAMLRWPGAVSFWTTLFRQTGATSLVVDQNLLDPTGVMTLADASDSLSPLRLPSLRFWVFVFGAYALLIGPCVFLVLRRLRAQTLAWVVLPVLSLVTTASIYVFGASERPEGALTEGVGVLDLVGNSEAASYGISSFMAPTEVSAHAATSQPTMLLPLAENGIRHVGTATVVQTPGASSVSFDNVGRWDVRYLYAAGSLANQGEVQTSLEATYYLTGIIVNHTPYALHDVAVFWNNRMYAIGDLPAGASKRVSAPASIPPVPDTWLLSYTNYNRDLARGIGHVLANYSSRLFNLSLDQTQAMIVATTSNRVPTLPKFQGIQPFASSDTLTLVRQFVPVANVPLG